MMAARVVSGRASVCSISVSVALSLSLVASWAIDLAVSPYFAISSRADRRVSSRASWPRSTMELPAPLTLSDSSSSWALRRAISWARSLPLWVAELRMTYSWTVGLRQGTRKDTKRFRAGSSETQRLQHLFGDFGHSHVLRENVHQGLMGVLDDA